MSLYTTTLKDYLTNYETSEEWQTIITRFDTIPVFNVNNLNLDAYTLFKRRYLMREIGSETTEKFCRFVNMQLDTSIIEFMPKIQAFLNNYGTLLNKTITETKIGTETDNGTENGTETITDSNTKNANETISDDINKSHTGTNTDTNISTENATETTDDNKTINLSNTQTKDGTDSVYLNPITNTSAKLRDKVDTDITETISQTETTDNDNTKSTTKDKNETNTQTLNEQQTEDNTKSIINEETTSGTKESSKDNNISNTKTFNLVMTHELNISNAKIIDEVQKLKNYYNKFIDSFDVCFMGIY